MGHVGQVMASRERRKWIGGFEKSWGYALDTRMGDAGVHK